MSCVCTDKLVIAIVCHTHCGIYKVRCIQSFVVFLHVQHYLVLLMVPAWRSGNALDSINVDHPGTERGTQVDSA